MQPFQEPERKTGRRLSVWQQFAYSIGNFGVAFGPTAVSVWLMLFYCGQEDANSEAVHGAQLYVSAGVFGVISFLAQLLNSVTDPLVGFLSDATRTRWGRRRPWILLGTPLLALSFFFLWRPISDTPSWANNVGLFLSLFTFYFSFTVVVAPYLALLPEITPYDNERVRISAFMGIFEVLGTIGGNLGTILVPLSLVVVGGFITSEFQALGLLGALALMLFFPLSIVFTRETYAANDQPNPGHQGCAHALKDMLSVFRNRAFPAYMFGSGFYRMAIATILTATPFIATKILSTYPITAGERGILDLLGAIDERGEIVWTDAAGYLLMLVLVGSALCFPLVSWLVPKTGKRNLYILSLFWLGIILLLLGTVGTWPVFTPLTQALILFGLAAFPVAVALVIIRPILADVIDEDEKLTGRRREGIYNGMEGFLQKTGAALAALTTGFFFAWFGNTAGHSLGIRLTGPFSGLCLFAAAFAFLRYPIKK